MPALWWAGGRLVNDEANLGEQLLDLLVYAPIGLLLEARDLIPKLADRGRGQVALARLAGKVAESQRRATDHELADEPDDHDAQDDQGGPNGGAASLPIENYASFSAPQLLAKLEALSEAQLAEILAYEKTHRNRQTVTNRIKQLLAANSSLRE